MAAPKVLEDPLFNVVIAYQRARFERAAKSFAELPDRGWRETELLTSINAFRYISEIDFDDWDELDLVNVTLGDLNSTIDRAVRGLKTGDVEKDND